ncbi:MAG: hypothetical protein DSM107014_13965 [Gomphosphaeria aponina SAG 52.96 = DSM 107014]|uniref:Uncharacterized protein n=1 Tax=Gomphosphaeria aponina SAG 52.96 = DSM 107014 TaxID=1521640 RepID=A0A941GSG4_9CHRO|nr:hypothetical protein [Gomphosphaeria aponina SAG 52.96 = DSM 107014]
MLATLYGWTNANDHQFLFKKTPPRLIYSVDHGHFFPNPPHWSLDDLLKSSPACLDPYFDCCKFSAEELESAYVKLLWQKAEGRRQKENPYYY